LRITPLTSHPPPPRPPPDALLSSRPPPKTPSGGVQYTVDSVAGACSTPFHRRLLGSAAAWERPGGGRSATGTWRSGACGGPCPRRRSFPTPSESSRLSPSRAARPGQPSIALEILLSCFVRAARPGQPSIALEILLSCFVRAARPGQPSQWRAAGCESPPHVLPHDARVASCLDATCRTSSGAQPCVPAAC
jgi:hypothetical protein